jgi:hypothetical protein
VEAFDAIREMRPVAHRLAPGGGAPGNMGSILEDIGKGDKGIEVVFCDSVVLARDGGELNESSRVETGKDGGEEFVGKGRHAGKPQGTISHLFLSSGEITVDGGSAESAPSINRIYNTPL